MWTWMIKRGVSLITALVCQPSINTIMSKKDTRTPEQILSDLRARAAEKEHDNWLKAKSGLTKEDFLDDDDDSEGYMLNEDFEGIMSSLKEILEYTEARIEQLERGDDA